MTISNATLWLRAAQVNAPFSDEKAILSQSKHHICPGPQAITCSFVAVLLPAQLSMAFPCKLASCLDSHAFYCPIAREHIFDCRAVTRQFAKITRKRTTILGNYPAALIALRRTKMHILIVIALTVPSKDRPRSH
jgi:hypothetical protein